ncbi:hypothetical protein K0M31_014223 [Melipona bicolor]|uniref:Uncharacterized protein n=1 Tax=Melipona bicolor TaxID=60889 RepID=A0AA40KTY3_9HYME|nr:hypothetical protein K0M31_014223 [Melipona bicolor]
MEKKRKKKEKGTFSKAIVTECGCLSSGSWRQRERPCKSQKLREENGPRLYITEIE